MCVVVALGGDHGLGWVCSILGDAVFNDEVAVQTLPSPHELGSASREGF